MTKRVLRFPRPPKPDPNGPIEWAIFQIGDSRAVIDLRGPEPKLRTEPAEVISIERKRRPSLNKAVMKEGLVDSD
jgi:hypothetical protein